jgi:uncharacterized protein (DUF58 family)
VLLGLALAAALYSSTSARNGQLPSALVGAVLALALAVWVAWRFVPRLASAVEWRWIASLARFRMTREGWVALGATFVVGLTAVNTSNNLLYMIFSALSASLLLAVVLAAVNLRSLELSASLPSECFARERFPLEVTIRNGKAVFPALSLRLVAEEGSLLRFDSAYFTVIGPRARESVTLATAWNRRGRHTIGTFSIESRYPFAFFVKRIAVPVAGEWTAYPELSDIETPGSRTPDAAGSRERIERGHGTDLYMIRDYQTTDSARRVDWKASAKTATLKTREFAAEDTRRVVLIFDRFGGRSEEARFEEQVSVAASIVVHLIRGGVEVGLTSDDWTSPFGSTSEVRRAILRYLALVEMDSRAPRPSGQPGGERITLSLR